MAKELIVTVQLKVNVDDWLLAYGIDEKDVAADVKQTLNDYKVYDKQIAGASDAPIKVHSVKSVTFLD